MLITAAMFVVAFVILLRWMRPLLAEAPGGTHRKLVLDVWLPVAIVLPVLGAAWHAGHDVGVAGWALVGAPIVGGAIAVALAVTASGDDLVPPTRVATWLAVATVVLLLTAAGELTIWAGQCFFAIGAVLMWMATPPPPTGEATDATDRAAGWGLLALIALALAAAVQVARNEAVIGIAAVGVIALTVVAARVAGPDGAARIGGTVATIGPLFGLGVLSLRRLLPESLAVALGARPQPVVKVAYGFGASAIEAALLLVVILLLVIAPRTSRAVRIGGGITAAGAALGIAIWRAASAL